MVTDVFGFIASCVCLIILQKKKRICEVSFYIPENCPIIQNPQIPKSDIVDDNGGETDPIMVPQASLMVVNLPPFPCLCNAHKFMNKVASL